MSFKNKIKKMNYVLFYRGKMWYDTYCLGQIVFNTMSWSVATKTATNENTSNIGDVLWRIK